MHVLTHSEASTNFLVLSFSATFREVSEIGLKGPARWLNPTFPPLHFNMAGNSSTDCVRFLRRFFSLCLKVRKNLLYSLNLKRGSFAHRTDLLLGQCNKQHCFSSEKQQLKTVFGRTPSSATTRHQKSCDCSCLHPLGAVRNIYQQLREAKCSLIILKNAYCPRGDNKTLAFKMK